MKHTEVIHSYGLFMVAWSVLDTVIEAAIMNELKIDASRALILTTSMQFKQRICVLTSLLELSGMDHSEAIKLLNRIEKDSKRNMLVHGHIIVGVPGELTFVKSSIFDGYNAKRSTFTAAQLNENILRLTEKTKKLQLLLSVSDSDMQSLANIGIKKSTDKNL